MLLLKLVFCKDKKMSLVGNNRALLKPKIKKTTGYMNFPGSSINPVGHAATPATLPATCGFTSTGASSSLWPGAYPGSLTAPGSSINPSSISNGTPTNPTIVSFQDFQAGITPGLSTTTTSFPVNGHDIIFIGCRFGFLTTPTSAADAITLGSSAYNIQFIYCTGAPLTNLVTSPPNPAWPSSGALRQTSSQIINVNCIDPTIAYQFWLGAYSTSTSGSFMVWVDHCNIWGFGNGALDTQTTTNQINFTSNWVHDACYSPGSSGYHQDGVGYFDGGNGPSNVLIQGNTIASLGNTMAIGWQGATSGYNNIIVNNNYLSGYQANSCVPGATNSVVPTNCAFINNIFGTDIPWWVPLYNATFGPIPNYTGTTNIWRNNTLRIVPGTSPFVWPSPFGAAWYWSDVENRYFILPDTSVGPSATDFTG